MSEPLDKETKQATTRVYANDLLLLDHALLDISHRRWVANRSVAIWPEQTPGWLAL